MREADDVGGARSRARSRPTEPSLVVVGAGAAGTALAVALKRSEWPIHALVCRTRASAKASAREVGAGLALEFAELASAARPEGAALLLVAVPDRHIEEVATELARQSWPEGSVALHLSGSVEVDALSALAARGLATGGLHPLRSFVEPARDATALPGTVMAVDGDEAALALAEELAERLGGRPFRLAPGARAAWHAAATHAANHLVALVDQSLDLMQRAGLERDEGRAALLPLLRSALDNLAHAPPGRALTGPVVRGDDAVVARHLAALSDEREDLPRAYRALARRALQLAREERSLDPERARRLQDLLAEPDA